jgi:signal transduction histidine kinase
MSEPNEHPTAVMAKHSRWRDAGLAVIASLLTAAIWLVGWLPAVERTAGDLLLRLPTTAPSPPPRIAAILIDDEAVTRFGPLPWPRHRLARVVEAVVNSGARSVVLDLILSETTGEETDRALAAALRNQNRVLAAAFDSEGSWLFPLDVFGGPSVAAHAYGEVGPDGVVRTFAATKQAHGYSIPALSLAAARTIRPELSIAPGSVLRPSFRPGPLQIETHSAAEAIDGKIRHEEIAGRIVFLGISATGAGDQFVVPTGPSHAPVPGVLAHASAAASILGNRLLRTPEPFWTALVGFLLAYAVQILRSRRGALDLIPLTSLFAIVGLLCVGALRFGNLLIPAATLGSVMVVSVLAREAVESQFARHESGVLLQSLLSHLGVPAQDRFPHTASRRLAALQRLQDRVLEEDAARQALLIGMKEGVVLWTHKGEVLEANPAAHRLWGGPPSLDEVVTATDESGNGEIHRGDIEIALTLSDLGTERLALLRDITAEKDLERRRREMQRLVSHELKTPLASIAGFGETLERYQLSGDEQQRVASLIRSEAGRLQEMVTVFLDLERLGSGQWKGDEEIIELGPLARSRIEVLTAAAEARGQTIKTSLKDGCTIRGVPALLERVVDNLIGNALKYSSDGDTVDVGVRHTENGVILEVRDQGQGIAPEAQPHLFERFYRAPGTEGAGAGLGLSLVKEVVDWHGGCISVESERGVGSVFTVDLPTLAED